MVNTRSARRNIIKVFIILTNNIIEPVICMHRKCIHRNVDIEDRPTMDVLTHMRLRRARYIFTYIHGSDLQQPHLIMYCYHSRYNECYILIGSISLSTCPGRTSIYSFVKVPPK
jgi:hypothetical protein